MKFGAILVVAAVAVGIVLVAWPSHVGPTETKPQILLAPVQFSYQTAIIRVQLAAPAAKTSAFHMRLDVNGVLGGNVSLPGVAGPWETTVSVGASSYQVDWWSPQNDGNLSTGGSFAITPSGDASPHFLQCKFSVFWNDGSPVANATFVWAPTWKLNVHTTTGGEGVDVSVAVPPVSPGDLTLVLQVNGINSTEVPLPTTPRTFFVVPVGWVNCTLTWVNESGTGKVSTGDWFQVSYLRGQGGLGTGTPMGLFLFRAGYGPLASVTWRTQTLW